MFVINNSKPKCSVLLDKTPFTNCAEDNLSLVRVAVMETKEEINTLIAKAHKYKLDTIGVHTFNIIDDSVQLGSIDIVKIRNVTDIKQVDYI